MAHTDDELLAMWRDDRRVDAIKIFRAERNLTLVQAKMAMERLDAGSPHQHPMLPEGVGAMTLRDYFAGLAMQGMCAHPDTWGLLVPGIAARAYEVADAMLDERAK